MSFYYNNINLISRVEMVKEVMSNPFFNTIVGAAMALVVSYFVARATKRAGKIDDSVSHDDLSQAKDECKRYTDDKVHPTVRDIEKIRFDIKEVKIEAKEFAKEQMRIHESAHISIQQQLNDIKDFSSTQFRMLSKSISDNNTLISKLIESMSKD